MKFACFALLVALLFVSARADNARKHRPVSLKFQCPLSTRYFKENLDAKQYTKKCLQGKSSPKNCDDCMTYVISKTAEDGVNAMGISKVLEFITRDDATAEEKMIAAAKACAPKVKKAMQEKGVSKNKLNKFLRYPNGGLYKCPWDITKYPQASKAALQIFGDIAEPLVGAAAAAK